MSLYLIQPCELKDTGRYKLGMSSKPDLSRVRSYHKGTRYLCIFECSNAKEVETILIQEFTKKYKLAAGKEYYNCNDEDEAIDLFINIFLKYRKKIEVKEEKSYMTELIEDVTDKLKDLTINSWMNRFAYKDINNKKI